MTATSGPVDQVEVTHYRLVKPYRVARFHAVSAELDRAAGKLAQQSKSGRLVARETMQVASRKTRYYRIEYGRGMTEEIAFVLRGMDEYQLLCRRKTSGSAAICDRLFTSFVLR